jgi:regulatory protein
MLSRRELSSAQVRERLARRGFEPDEIEDALARLEEAGAVNDWRVAVAVARTRAVVRRQGRARVGRELSAIGLPSDAIDRALEEVFGSLDEDALIEQALSRRLRGTASLDDPRVERRVFAALFRQGFDADAIRRVMRKRS